MCGRFTLTSDDPEALASVLSARLAPADRERYRPRYNVAPTDEHWIVRIPSDRQLGRQLQPARWGLVNHWARDARAAARQINARVETVMQRPAFREAFASRRCLVPADGFYEWRRAGTQRQPLRFHHPDGQPLLFAGLYERWRDPARPEAEPRLTFTIVTRAADPVVAPVHDRMPLILPAGASELLERWLLDDALVNAESPHELARLLEACEQARPPLLATAVSPRVNSVKNDDPACLQPLADGEPAAAQEAPPGRPAGKRQLGFDW